MATARAPEFGIMRQNRADHAGLIAAGRPWRVPAPRRKYHNTITEVDGIRFDSLREARRYAELRLLERAGEIVGLELQPAFPLYAPVMKGNVITGRVCVGSYVGDFRYREANGRVVVEDAKGVRTPLYRLKRKIVEAQYGIRIQEV
jgi:uncharacterized protein DUF1064